MKTFVEVKGNLHASLTLALGGGDWPASRSDHFTYGKRVPATFGQESGCRSWSGCGDQEEKSIPIPGIEAG